MSTFAAKVAGNVQRGGGPHQHHHQQGAGLSREQRNGGGPAPTPARQTVGFSVPSNSDRLGFIGNVLIGYKVEVQVTSGIVYEGVFGSLQNDSGSVSVVLKFAKIIKDPSAPTSNRTALAEKPVPILTIPGTDLVQLFAKDIRLSPEHLSGTDRSDVGFETDAAISRGRGGAVRELQRWQPDEADDSANFALESTGGSQAWDQFAVNRDRFGVQTTWNEHFYTTKIRRDECRITDEEAARIAREIEMGVATGGTVTTNIHLLEERGGELAPDVDEEALYGAVIRDHPLPPAPGVGQQPQQHHQPRQQQRSRVPQPSAADRAVAWGRVGSGVAAVAGGLTGAAVQHQHPQHLQQQPHHQQSYHQQLHPQHLQPAMPGPPQAPAPKSASVPVPVPGASTSSSGGGAPVSDGASGSAGGTAPIDIDARKEVNKVRSSLTVGPRKDRSSPFGTPKLGMSRSPVFASPLVADPMSLTALDLDPGSQAKLDPEAQAEFLRFKEEMNKKRQQDQMGADVAELRKSSTGFKDRPAPASGASGAAAASATAVPASAEPSAPTPAGTGALAVGAASPAAAVAPAAFAVPPAAATAVAPPARGAASAVVTAAANGEEPKPKVVSKLNPNAKPFSLNINAKEFVPSFGQTAKPAAPVPPAAPAAWTPATVPAKLPAPVAAAPVAAAPAAAPAPAAPAPPPAAPAPVPVPIPSIVANNAAAAAPAAAAAAAAAISASLPVLSSAASNAASAPPAVAAAAAQAATTALSNSGHASYLVGSGASHGLSVTYHHSSAGHASHAGQHNQYGHSGGHGGMLHHGGGGHGHGGAHGHEPRGGFGGGSGAGPMGRDLRDHTTGPVYHRGSDNYRGGGGGPGDGPGGYRGGGGGDPFRSGSGSGDGFHHHHHHHKAGQGGPQDHHHHQLKGAADNHAAGAGGPSGLHKVPPPPPQAGGPMTTGEGHMGPMIMNGVAQAAMTAHGIMPMTQAMAAGMSTMGAVPYGVVMAPHGSYMTSAMPPGAVAMASTAGGPVPIMYAVRPAGGGHTMAMAAGPGMAMMGAPGMASHYGTAVGPYMTAPPGSMPPPSPSGRPPATGYFQPAGNYGMIATAHPGGPHGHHAGPMAGQPGGPMGHHHMMQGPGAHPHSHGPMGHMQDARGQGGMGPGGGPKGGGRQGGGRMHGRMDHDRSGPRDMD